MTLTQQLITGQPDGTAATTGNTGAASMNTGDGSIVWSTAMGAHGQTGLKFTPVTASLSLRYNLPACADMQFTGKLTTPAATPPTGGAVLMTIRYSGGVLARLAHMDSDAMFLTFPSTVTANGSAIVASGGVAHGHQYVVALTVTGAGTASATMTASLYEVGGTTPVGTVTVPGLNMSAGQIVAVDLAGDQVPVTHGWVDVQYNDGSGTEIPDYVPSTPLATPVVTLGAKVDATSSANGSQTVSWPAVPNAASYDAYIAAGSSPAQSDFTLVKSGVTSPYQFTGLAAGTWAYGIKARA